MKDGHQFDDNYAVEPAAMSDEQIARRDAMSIVELADNAAATSVSLNALLEQVCRQVERLEREREEMGDLLYKILHKCDCSLGSEITARVNKLLASGLIRNLSDKLLAGG